MKTHNPQALAAIPIHIVAGIAAQLSATEPDPVERVRQAYTLLDIAEDAHYGLETAKCYNWGLDDYVSVRKSGIEMREHLRDPLVVIDEMGQCVPVDFEKAVSSIFGRSIKKHLREKHLALFLIGQPELVDADLCFETGIQKVDPREAEKCVRDWKEKGIPEDAYFKIKRIYPYWKSRQTSNARSFAGKTKGTQGRVVRKNDKRKGSRAGSILKRLKKTA
jgi:hypothetical protein